jgi:hypothetical protein
MAIAFAWLLVSVRLRFQGLFATDLQPLLGNYYLYQWQLSTALGEHNGTWKISWSGQPESTVKLAAAWHEMRHRRILLRDVTSTLMLQDEGTKGYWRALGIYFTAPTLGMLAAAQVFLRARRGVGPYCAKLHHAINKRFICRMFSHPG